MCLTCSPVTTQNMLAVPPFLICPISCDFEAGIRWTALVDPLHIHPETNGAG